MHKLIFSILILFNSVTDATAHDLMPNKESSASANASNAKDNFAQQRAIFRQIESLLNTIKAQRQFSQETEQTIDLLLPLLENYPLYWDLNLSVIDRLIDAEQYDRAIQKLDTLIAQNPPFISPSQLHQRKFELLFKQQKWQAFIEFAQQNPPTQPINKCRYFDAQYELFTTQFKLPPQTKQTENPNPLPTELKALLDQFDEIWINEPEIAKHCTAIEAYWQKQGRKTQDKIQSKSLVLLRKKDLAGLTELIANSTDEVLNDWIKQLQLIITTPNTWQKLVEMLPLDDANQQMIYEQFFNFIRTLSEQLDQPNFTVYQRWAEKWQFTPSQINAWKIAFLKQFFDNKDVNFQLWRDQQIAQLRDDGLIERRLRLAILHQQNLTYWLRLLSEHAKTKSEWRYWLAKVEQSQSSLAKLATERGFYAMLAAKELGIVYLPQNLTIAPLDKSQYQRLSPIINRISEFYQLNREHEVKSEWRRQLRSLSFAQQIAISEMALSQNWFNLAVEGTIQAKAWDYLALRFPRAYADFFDIALTQTSRISKTFAMAIARQESAWDPFVQSSANAKGLMQLQPATARQTAKQKKLPYSNENTLFIPLYNILLGTAYLTELAERFNGNRILIAAAYNAGARRVDEWLRRSNNRLQLDEFIASIPFYETRNYVQNVLTYDYYQQFLQSTKQAELFLTNEINCRY